MSEILTPQLALRIFRELQERGERPSCNMVGRELAERGIVSPKTQRPYSRQAVRNNLSRTPEGRAYLQASDRRRVARLPRPDPLIVNYDTEDTKWLQEAGIRAVVTTPYHVERNPSMVTGRIVYGDIPVSIAAKAGTVYTVGRDREGKRKLFKYNVTVT
jgi:hypothetical protein